VALQAVSSEKTGRLADADSLLIAHHFSISLGTGVDAIPARRFGILRYIIGHINAELARRWVHAFLGHHIDQLLFCKSMPEEGHLLVVPRNTLETRSGVFTGAHSS
jgi:hypothetical protein